MCTAFHGFTHPRVRQAIYLARWDVGRLDNPVEIILTIMVLFLMVWVALAISLDIRDARKRSSRPNRYNSYQGLAGMLSTGLGGILLGLLYLSTKRNLWTCVIVHGLNDTIASFVTLWKAT